MKRQFDVPSEVVPVGHMGKFFCLLRYVSCGTCACCLDWIAGQLMANFRQEITSLILAIQCSHVQGVKEGVTNVRWCALCHVADKDESAALTIELHSDSGRKLWESVDLGSVCWTIYPISHLNAHRERSTQSTINRTITPLPPQTHTIAQQPLPLPFMSPSNVDNYVMSTAVAEMEWPQCQPGLAATCSLYNVNGSLIRVSPYCVYAATSASGIVNVAVF